MGAENRRDSRTAEERAADQERERSFHRKRQQAGLPALNYEATFSFSVRDITDADASVLHDSIAGAVVVQVEQLAKPENPLERSPNFAGSTYTTEKNIEAP